jgi:peptidoglycan-associated lipoprotein
MNILKIKRVLLLLIVVFLVSACKTTSSNDSYDVIDTEEQAGEENLTVETTTAEDRVYFGLDKYNLNKKSEEVLNVQAEWLKNTPEVNILIEGHCDERGTREYNLALGERRANAVRDYLIKKGVSRKRVRTVSYGKERPIYLGTGENIWSKNRVAITVEVTD